jgi:Ser/Thr protein kinase RdoA (MazF antagonist)
VTATTHEVTVDGATVVKTFRSWDRDEPEREWTALELLHRSAPGLAPEPVSRGEREGRPSVVMSRLPGVSLGNEPLSHAQVAAVAAAMSRLHSAVPRGELDRLPHRISGACEMVRDLRAGYAVAPVPGLEPEVVTAVEEARRWLSTSEPDALADPAGHLVFAQADGNLANYLWDGERCRLVDFEDSGVSDRAYEVADLAEHVSAWLIDVLDGDLLVELLDLDEPARQRVRRMRRLFATFWLHMLLPGNRGHHRNPPGSVERQARRTLALLA